MGIIGKLFETKYCCVCGKAVNMFGNKKLIDGFCCPDCSSKFSPYFNLEKTHSISDIKYQIKCREENHSRIRQFNITRIISSNPRVLIDEGKEQFAISYKTNIIDENCDIIDFSSITSCNIDIEELHEEMKYEDSNGNTKSFSPPCYACSYNFYVEITVNIPYINVIRFKINDKPIDNNQKTFIKIDNGILGRFADALLPSKSYNGKTSNADEVKDSILYKKCEEISLDIKNSLLSSRSAKNSLAKDKIVCPWCDSLVDSSIRICNHCGGRLDN